MALNKIEKIGIGIGGTAVLVTTIILINRAKQKNLAKDLNAVLDKDPGSAVTQQITKDAFDPNVWRQYTGGTTTIGPATFPKIAGSADFQGIAQNINDDYHYLLPNNSTDVLKQFAKLKTRAQVSYLAYIFPQKFGTALLDFMNAHFSDIAMQINSYVAGLPMS